MEGSKTFSPAYETDVEKGGRSAPVIFGASPVCKECNGLSIRWLCRRGPVPSVYNWDTWLEDRMRVPFGKERKQTIIVPRCARCYKERPPMSSPVPVTRGAPTLRSVCEG